MSERPIIFSGPMVRAILDGRKTQTRRIVQWPTWAKPEECGELLRGSPTGIAFYEEGHARRRLTCPYGVTGDRLWVRETWKRHVQTSVHTAAIYRADYVLSEGPGPWKPSIFMPRWASRLLLEITAVRVERVQEISEADAIAEGCEKPDGMPIGPRFMAQVYREVFCQVNKSEDAWIQNPWVWVVSFRKV